MANLPINPEYNENVRQLETSDPSHADTFNPNFQTLVNNDAYLKRELDIASAQSKTSLDTSRDANEKSDHAVETSETVRNQFDRVVAEAGENNPEVVQARKDKVNLNARLDEFDRQFADSDRQTTVLSQGVSVVSGETNAPASVEIEGRTLVSLGNTPLETNKKYVLADKKTKVIVDGVMHNGVAKFNKTGEAARAAIVRVANFEGKVSGSAAENPHIARQNRSNSLISPTGSFGSELPTLSYDRFTALDGTLNAYSSVDNGAMVQQLFSFNLIEEVERNIGRIPRATVADKVAWLKANVGRLTGNWHGFGSSVGGNKATVAFYHNTAIYTDVADSHVFGTTRTIVLTSRNASGRIDNNGFVHFLAYAEPSDGTTPSVINTDYVELEIELKPDADFTHPKVPLYEVTDDAYNKILIDWNAEEVMRRYPVVEGVQHLQGVGVVAEGENLLPPFTEATLSSASKVISPYEVEHNPTSNAQDFLAYTIPANPNQPYTFSIDKDGWASIREIDASGIEINRMDLYRNVNMQSFTTKPNTRSLRFWYGNITYGAGTYWFKNPTLTLGSTPKPFTPRNPSYLFADVKLGAIGTVRDMLYEQDGRWLLRKVVEKDVVLDGRLEWRGVTVYPSFKIAYIGTSILSSFVANNQVVIKNDGSALRKRSLSWDSYTSGDITELATSYLYVAINDSNSGWNDIFTPTANDAKRYFNGWKYTDGTTWQSVTGNGQTATAQQALDTKPTDYTPYKLSYVLATPQIIDVTDKVEGSLKVNGLTQVEVLSGFVNRERTIPKKTTHVSGLYLINDISTFYNVINPLKYRVSRILGVYKNGVLDNQWTIQRPNQGEAFGDFRAYISPINFDTTAEYTVTYLMDKHKLTTNPTNVKLTYAKNIRGAVDDVVTKVQDNSTMLSVHAKTLIELYVRLKALESGV